MAMSVTFHINRQPVGFTVSCAFDTTVHPSWEDASAAVAAHGRDCAELAKWNKSLAEAGPEAYWRAVEEFQASHPKNRPPDWCLGYWGAEPVYDGDAPEVNLANANARSILELLGYDRDDLCGQADGETFLGRVLLALALAPADAGVPAYESLGSNGARLIDCGRSEGYHQRVLGQLAELAEHAVATEHRIHWS
jgi:hypothetical protein